MNNQLFIYAPFSLVISPTHIQLLKDPMNVTVTSLTVVTVTLNIDVSQTTMSVMEEHPTAQMEEMKTPVYVMLISRMHDS